MTGGIRHEDTRCSFKKGDVYRSGTWDYVVMYDYDHVIPWMEVKVTIYLCGEHYGSGSCEAAKLEEDHTYVGNGLY